MGVSKGDKVVLIITHIYIFIHMNIFHLMFHLMF